jgi:hypothetical protein
MEPPATLTRDHVHAAERAERVVVYVPEPRTDHERTTLIAVAEKIAAVLGVPYGGVVAGPPARRRGIYLIPGDTIVGEERARSLGIRGEGDFFGGVVPYPFVAGKAIVHPLFDDTATAPPGWSRDLARQIEDAVHVGYAAFARADARRGGERLLERGAVRVKPVCARGGLGQRVVGNVEELDAALAACNEAELATHGLVLEENLAEVETYSIGQLRVGDLLVSYFGTQRLTRSNHGRSVYGGSALAFVRGGFEALDTLDLDIRARLAVAQARLFDAAVFATFPGMLASRRNYDVAQGRDTAGRWRSGVLEQSWRIGGASPAEAEALEAFRRDPARATVRAACFEFYGTAAKPPPHACIYFLGNDEQAGPLVKYAVIEPDADAGS